VLWASVLICAFTLSIGAMLFYKLVPLFLKFIFRRIGIISINSEDILNKTQAEKMNFKK